MKKIIYLTSTIICLAFLSAFSIKTSNHIEIESLLSNDYCDGWEDGYCEGWRDIKGQFAICPITPICPIPEVGKSRYRDGYNRGFKAGSRAAQR